MVRYVWLIITKTLDYENMQFLKGLYKVKRHFNVHAINSKNISKYFNFSLN